MTQPGVSPAEVGALKAERGRVEISNSGGGLIKINKNKNKIIYFVFQVKFTTYLSSSAQVTTGWQQVPFVNILSVVCPT